MSHHGFSSEPQSEKLKEEFVKNTEKVRAPMNFYFLNFSLS